MRELPHPPSVPVVGEHPAVIEPALRDLPEFRAETPVGDAEPVKVRRTEDDWAQLVASALEVANTDERFRELVADRSHTVIGVSRLDRKRRKARELVLLAYCHDDGLSYETRLREEDDALRVRSVRATSHHPAPSDAEVEQALALVSGHRLVRDRLDEGYDGHVLCVSDVEPGDEHHGRRRFSVVFGPADERLPHIHAVVDLGSERLLWVHTEGAER